MSLFGENFMKDKLIRIGFGLLICTIALVIVINDRTNTISPAKNDTKDKVTISITGEVVNPGSYKINKNTSLWDNATAFGGFTPYADLAKSDIYSPINENKNIVIKKQTSKKKNDYSPLYDFPE